MSTADPPVRTALAVFLFATLAAAGVGVATGDPLSQGLTSGLVVGAAAALAFYYLHERRT